MLEIRDKIELKYKDKEDQWREITTRYGNAPYQPTLFSFWYALVMRLMRRMCSVLNASGVEKEHWFTLQSTEKRLEYISQYMSKHSSVCGRIDIVLGPAMWFQCSHCIKDNFNKHPTIDYFTRTV